MPTNPKEHVVGVVSDGDRPRKRAVDPNSRSVEQLDRRPITLLHRDGVPLNDAPSGVIVDDWVLAQLNERGHAIFVPITDKAQLKALNARAIQQVKTLQDAANAALEEAASAALEESEHVEERAEGNR